MTKHVFTLANSITCSIYVRRRDWNVELTTCRHWYTMLKRYIQAFNSTFLTFPTSFVFTFVICNFVMSAMIPEYKGCSVSVLPFVFSRFICVILYLFMYTGLLHDFHIRWCSCRLTVTRRVSLVRQEIWPPFRSTWVHTGITWGYLMSNLCFSV